MTENKLRVFETDSGVSCLNCILKGQDRAFYLIDFGVRFVAKIYRFDLGLSSAGVENILQVRSFQTKNIFPIFIVII